jgi:hypothetical protein
LNHVSPPPRPNEVRRLWIYKCNAANLTYQTAWGDWTEFFASELPQAWGGTWATRSAASLRLIWNEVAKGDLVLAYQSNLRAAIGLCEVDDLDDYEDEGGFQREIILRPVERFLRPVKLHDLKSSIPELASVKALRPALIQTIYATTIEEANVLLAACDAHLSTTAPAAGLVAATGSSKGGGFGDPQTNKLVETAAVEHVTRFYRRLGWALRSVENEKIGYDLCAKKGDLEEHLEVKGVRGSDLCFIITGW